MTYLITFACYGRHLHGVADGAVDHTHRVYGGPLVDGDAPRASAERERMDQAPYELDETRRGPVLESLREVCAFKGWSLLAAHVRSSHVHVVVEAEDEPERVMNAFKSYASRRLNKMKLDVEGRKRWARHGSTRRLWKGENVRGAIHYVVYEQGAPMAVFQSDESKSEP